MNPRRDERENLEGAIAPVKEGEIEKPIEYYYEYHDKLGRHTDSEKNACAKKVSTSNVSSKILYYIKTSGSLFYNPEEAKSDLRYDRRNWKLYQVSEQAYNLYVNFLKNGRVTLLHHAERLI